MHLRNRAFQVRANIDKQRKLEIVLRQLTGDHLTAQQRQLICQAVGCREQYSIQLRQGSKPPSDIAVAEEGRTIIRQIFGDTEGETDGPTAVLIRTPVQGGMSNKIYIYLPTPREENGDDTQQKESSDQ